MSTHPCHLVTANHLRYQARLKEHLMELVEEGTLHQSFGRRSMPSGQKCFHSLSASRSERRFESRVSISAQSSKLTIRQIFSTGKSLNFIRYSCLDSDWVVTREKMSNTSGSASLAMIRSFSEPSSHPALQYGDIQGLERSIDSAYQVASHRLFEVFIHKFKLLDHLSALKSYLLLGHGDFADQLMETLGY